MAPEWQAKGRFGDGAVEPGSAEKTRRLRDRPKNFRLSERASRVRAAAPTTSNISSRSAPNHHDGLDLRYRHSYDPSVTAIMAGGLVKYRHLSRNSAARKALLRGLVTQLVQYEHIQTTYAKAKETQRMAEKLITLAKRNNEPCRRNAQGMLYTPHIFMPKLFGELRERYLPRAGGYTRVVRTEPKNLYDQGESAILEFVDGPKDSRFMMTAKAVARDRAGERDHTPVTLLNVKKVTAFRGAEPFEEMVQKFIGMDVAKTAAIADGSYAAAEAAKEAKAVAEAKDAGRFIKGGKKPSRRQRRLVRD
ncbi:hypothetical protein G7046_g8217 [Stylonectria norvegica]|nr:hypothetical protein G7046_g8217 [Stylonectria norvegica]